MKCETLKRKRHKPRVLQFLHQCHESDAGAANVTNASTDIANLQLSSQSEAASLPNPETIPAPVLILQIQIAMQELLMHITCCSMEHYSMKLATPRSCTHAQLTKLSKQSILHFCMHNLQLPKASPPPQLIGPKQKLLPVATL